MSAPIWAVVALLQSWLLASPGEDVRPDRALWSVRPVERRAPYQMRETPRRTPAAIPALTVDLQTHDRVVPKAVAPVRVDGLNLCGPDWARVGCSLEPESTASRLPWSLPMTPCFALGAATTHRDREVHSYLRDLHWRQPLPHRSDSRTAFRSRAAADWAVRIDAPGESEHLGLDVRFEDGTVSWSRYIDDDPQRAFVREALNSVGLPDGIYWNKAVFLPMAGFGNTTYWFGINMRLRW